MDVGFLFCLGVLGAKFTGGMLVGSHNLDSCLVGVGFTDTQRRMVLRWYDGLGGRAKVRIHCGGRAENGEKGGKWEKNED